VRRRRAQRVVWLVGVTLVAAIGALALSRRDADGNQAVPRPVTVPGTSNGYYTARVAPLAPSAYWPSYVNVSLPREISSIAIVR
jgi:hypothetical protein